MASTFEGIDVSRWQGVVNWPNVRGAGKQFAFIRLGWAGYDGSIISNGGLDANFDTNMRGALAAGMDVGVYVYSYCQTAAAARAAAAETLYLIRDYQVTYPVVFDIEDAMYHSMGRATNTSISNAFLSEVESGGYYSMLYTFKSFAETYLNMTQLSAYDVWIAQWSSANTYSGNYGIWQYSNTGRVSGISGNVDLNTAYRDYPALIRSAGLNNLSPDGGGTDPAPDPNPSDRLVLLEERIRQIKVLVEDL